MLLSCLSTASLSVDQSRNPSDGDDGCGAHSPVVRQSQSDGHDGDGVSLVLCVKDGWAVQNAGKLAQRTSTQLHEHKRTTANRAAGAKQHL